MSCLQDEEEAAAACDGKPTKRVIGKQAQWVKIPSFWILDSIQGYNLLITLMDGSGSWIGYNQLAVILA